jgi:hypothetical protein
MWPDHGIGATLAICRDEDAFRSVLKRRQEFAGPGLVVASDDWRVHAAASESAHDGVKVVWLDQNETFFDAAPHVLDVLGEVNAWLKAQGNSRFLPVDLLYWVQHVEGGNTTQRISDAILEARACFALIDNYQPSSIVIGDAAHHYWQDRVVVSCAAERNIVLRRLGLFKFRKFIQAAWHKFRPFAVESYQVALVLDAIARRRASSLEKKVANRYVAIQMCTRGAGHFANTFPLVEALEREGLATVQLTYRVGRTATELRTKGYKVVELEAWIPIGAIFAATLAIGLGLRRMWANKAALLPHGLGGAYAKAIRPVLLDSMSGFFISDLPQLIRLDAALRSFIAAHPPAAARLWTNILYEGVLAFRAMTTVGVRPLLFRQVGLDLLANPYLRHDVAVDLYFCTSQAARDRLRKEGEQNCEIVVSGSPSRQRIEDFASHHTQDQSRVLLGIDKNARFVVFCDAQIAFKGYFSPGEQEQLVRVVMEFAERHEDVCVILKPHPTYQPGPVEAIIKGRGCGRLIWISATELPEHALNASDVMLTKFSTLAADAMVLGIPVICVLLDKDKRWAVYGDAVDYAMTTDQLGSKLDELRDADCRKIWRGSLRESQVRFIEQQFPKPSENNPQLVARKVREAVDAWPDQALAQPSRGVSAS